jgi:hypothetical protein
MFTNTEKLACVERELKMRKKVYRRWVGTGRMSVEQAKREIELMEAIVADYTAAAVAKGEQLL